MNAATRLLDLTRDVFSGSKAAATPPPPPPPGPLSARSLLERGPSPFAERLSGIGKGSTLLLFERRGAGHPEWSEARGVIPEGAGGFVSARDIAEWVALHHPRLAGEFRGEPGSGCVLAVVESPAGPTAHLFLRIGDAWFDEAALEEYRAAHRAKAAAEARAAYDACEAQTRARHEAEERVKAEELAKRRAEMAERTEAIEIAGAEAKAERVKAEGDRLDALAALAADPITIIRLAEALDLVDEAGNLRPCPRHDDLEELDERVFASGGVLALVAEHRPRADVARAAVAGVARFEASNPGRRPLRADLSRPRSDGRQYGSAVVEAIAMFDGRLLAHVDRDGIVRLLTRDERAPLSWWL